MSRRQTFISFQNQLCAVVIGTIAALVFSSPTRADAITDACGPPPPTFPEFSEAETRSFARALVQSVRTDLRTAVLLNERNIACFKSDGAWFGARGIPWDDQTRDECKRRVANLTEIARANLPELRLRLALSDVALEGDSHDASYADPVSPAQIESWLKSQPYQFDHFLTREITHRYRDLADLDPLTPNEIRRAMTELANWAAEFKTVVPAARPQFFNQKRLESGKRYRALIANNPILAFLPHPVATGDELVAALEHVDARARDAGDRIASEFYERGELIEAKLTLENLLDLSVQRASLSRLVQSKPESCPIAYSTLARARTRRLWNSFGLLAGATVMSVACQVVKSRVPGLRFINACGPVIGLGLTAEGLYNAEREYRAALDGVLQSPYGWTALNDMDQLDQVQFEAAINWVLAPFVPGVTRLISPKNFRTLIRATIPRGR